MGTTGFVLTVTSQIWLNHNVRIFYCFDLQKYLLTFYLKVIFVTKSSFKTYALQVEFSHHIMKELYTVQGHQNVYSLPTLCVALYGFIRNSDVVNTFQFKPSFKLDLYEILIIHLFLLILVFAWQAYERGSDVHLEADPTKLALLSKEFKVKKEEYEQGQKESILERVSTIIHHALASY